MLVMYKTITDLRMVLELSRNDKLQSENLNGRWVPKNPQINYHSGGDTYFT